MHPYSFWGRGILRERCSADIRKGGNQRRKRIQALIFFGNMGDAVVGDVGQAGREEFSQEKIECDDKENDGRY